MRVVPASGFLIYLKENSMELKIEKLDVLEAPFVVSEEFVVGAILGALIGLLIFT